MDLFNQLVQVVGKDNPLTYVGLAIALLYTILTLTQNVRYTLTEIKGKYKQLELQKLQMEVMKLKHEIQELGIDTLEIDQISHPLIEIAEKKKATTFLFRVMQSGWFGKLTLVIANIIFFILGFFLSFISIGGFISADYIFASIVLIIGISFLLFNYRSFKVLEHYRAFNSSK